MGLLSLSLFINLIAAINYRCMFYNKGCDFECETQQQAQAHTMATGHPVFGV